MALGFRKVEIRCGLKPVHYPLVNQSQREFFLTHAILWRIFAERTSLHGIGVSYQKAMTFNPCSKIANTNSEVIRYFIVIVPIALFASLSRRDLGTRPIVSCGKAAPAKRSEKGDRDEKAIWYGVHEYLARTCTTSLHLKRGSGTTFNKSHSANLTLPEHKMPFATVLLEMNFGNVDVWKV